MDFLKFRSDALSALALLPLKDRPRFKSMEDRERWVKECYEKYYPKKTKGGCHGKKKRV